jgi:hypothetical protein
MIKSCQVMKLLSMTPFVPPKWISPIHNGEKYRVLGLGLLGIDFSFWDKNQ